MNAATAVFLILVLIVAAFFGMGYLINSTMNQAERISQLEQQISQLQNALAAAQQADQSNRAKIQELQQQILKLQEALSAAEKADALNQSRIQDLQAYIGQLTQQLAATQGPTQDAARSQERSNFSLADYDLGAVPTTPLQTGVLLITAILGLGEAYAIRRIRNSYHHTQSPAGHHATGKQFSEPSSTLTVRMTVRQAQDYAQYRRQHPDLG